MDVLYTTTEAIRAALGVTVKDVSDSQLTDLNLTDQLSLELDAVYPDHAAAKTAAEDVSPSAAEVRVFKIIKLFCQYQGAVFTLPGYQNLIAQKVSDGGFEMQRFVKDDIEKTKVEILSMRDKYKSLLELELDSTDTQAPYAVLVVAVPNYDPVTDEGT